MRRFYRVFQLQRLCASFRPMATRSGASGCGKCFEKCVAGGGERACLCRRRRVPDRGWDESTAPSALGAASCRAQISRKSKDIKYLPKRH